VGDEITVVFLSSILFGSSRSQEREGGGGRTEITVVFLSSILFGSPRSQGRGGRRRAKRSLLCFSLRYCLEVLGSREGEGGGGRRDHSCVSLFDSLGVLAPRGGERGGGGRRDHCCVSSFDTLWES
jgi:hypothetical protein